MRAIAERAAREVEDEQQAAAKRMHRADGDGRAAGYIFAVLAFGAAWEPAELGGGRKKGKRRAGA